MVRLGIDAVLKHDSGARDPLGARASIGTC